MHVIGSAPVNRVETLRGFLIDRSLSERATNLHQFGGQPSTVKAYESAWRSWCSWCDTRGHDPLSTDIVNIIEYLVNLSCWEERSQPLTCIHQRWHQLWVSFQALLWDRTRSLPDEDILRLSTTATTVQHQLASRQGLCLFGVVGSQQSAVDAQAVI